MKLRSKSVAIALVLAVIVAAGATLLVVRPWEHGETTASVGPTVSRGGACLEGDVVPSFVPALSKEDCVTSVSTVPDEYVAVGTKEGLFGIIRDGVLETRRPPGATGAVTDVIAGQDVAWFVVDQGIGLYNIREDEFVRPPEGASLVTAGYYTDPPGPGRVGWLETRGYVKDTEDGVRQRVGFDIAVNGAVCAVYMSDPADVPAHIWCTDPGTLFPAPVVTVVPRLSDEPGGCAHNTTPVEDRSHRLTLVVTKDGFEPERLTIRAGEEYTITVDIQDENRAHLFAVRGVRDAEGFPICTGAVSRSTDPSVTFTINEPGTYVFDDSVHAGFTGELVVTAGDRLSPPEPVSPPASLN